MQVLSKGTRVNRERVGGVIRIQDPELVLQSTITLATGKARRIQRVAVWGCLLPFLPLQDPALRTVQRRVVAFHQRAPEVQDTQCVPIMGKTFEDCMAMMDLSVISLRNFDTRFAFIGPIEAEFHYRLRTSIGHLDRSGQA